MRITPALALAAACTLAGIAVATAAAGPRESLLATWAEKAKADDPSFAGFSPARGEAFYRARTAGGQPDTPSCTACHGESPLSPGRSRAGKEIAPMAASGDPGRYTDPEKVEKWFGRNCQGVLGRPCSPREKGDFVAYMLGL